MGPQLLVQLVLNLSQLAVHGAAAVAAAPGALIRRIHAGAQIPAFSHGLHQVIEAGAGQIRRQPTAARRSADHLHQSGLLQLFQDFIGKGLGGDKVIVFSPFYENYGADTILSGAEPIYVPLHPPAFTFDVDELEAAFRQRPKALVLCNPSNPCGRVFTREELLTIAEMATRYDTYVITDEVYEHIVYAPHRHTYFATLPGMWNRTLSCSSLSKTYSITGWRLGYIIAPEEIIDRAKKVHDFLTVGCAAPLQEAVIPGLEFGQDYYDDLLAKYTHKKDLFLKGLDDLHISHNDPEGAYYVLLDIREYGYESDLQFCKNLAREVGVGAVSGSSFFREPVNHLIRMHFARGTDVLDEAVRRLEKLQALLK